MNISTVKQVLPELVAILPNSDRSVEQPIEVTVTICHILINLSHASLSNTSAIINQGVLPKIISISSKDNGYGFFFRYISWMFSYMTCLIYTYHFQLNIGLDQHGRAKQPVFYFIPCGDIQSCTAVSRRWDYYMFASHSVHEVIKCYSQIFWGKYININYSISTVFKEINAINWGKAWQYY